MLFRLHKIVNKANNIIKSTFQNACQFMFYNAVFDSYLVVMFYVEHFKHDDSLSLYLFDN